MSPRRPMPLLHITSHKKSNNPTPRKRGHTKVFKLTGRRSRGASENLRAAGAGEAVTADNRRCRSLPPVTSTASATRATMELPRTGVN